MRKTTRSRNACRYVLVYLDRHVVAQDNGALVEDLNTTNCHAPPTREDLVEELVLVHLVLRVTEAYVEALDLAQLAEVRPACVESSWSTALSSSCTICSLWYLYSG